MPETITWWKVTFDVKTEDNTAVCFVDPAAGDYVEGHILKQWSGAGLTVIGLDEARASGSPYHHVRIMSNSTIVFEGKLRSFEHVWKECLRRHDCTINLFKAFTATGITNRNELEKKLVVSCSTPAAFRCKDVPQCAKWMEMSATKIPLKKLKLTTMWKLKNILSGKQRELVPHGLALVCLKKLSWSANTPLEVTSRTEDTTR